MEVGETMSQEWDSNPLPIAYEAIALPIELPWHTWTYCLVYEFSAKRSNKTYSENGKIGV